MRDQHRGHPRLVCGLNAQQAVLDDETILRGYPHFGGREEKEVRGGLAAFDIIRCHNHRKHILQSDELEGVVHVVGRPPGGNAEDGSLLVAGPRIGHNLGDRSDFRLMLVKINTFLPYHDIRVDLNIVGCVPVLDGLPQGHPGHAHEALPIELERSLGSGQSMVPCPQMKGHGIRKRAITVEYVAAVFFPRRDEWVHRLMEREFSSRVQPRIGDLSISQDLTRYNFYINSFFRLIFILMAYDIKAFQKRYGLSNKDMADICGCSLPTIQKWRSGEVDVSGAASQLMRLLDFNAEANPARLRDLLGRMNQQLKPLTESSDLELKELESSMTKVVDRIELMLNARRKEKELADSEARYRSMLESFKTPVCRWLPDTTLTYVNESYARLFSKFGDNLIGRKWLDFIPSEKRPELAAIVSDMVRRGEEETMIHESVDKDGNIRFQEWKDIPVKDERGEVIELHSIGHDETELVLLKREVDNLQKFKAASLRLCDQPMMVFDEEGRILEINDRFQEDLLRERSWTNLADMMESFPSRKFRRLLKRLSGDEELCYCMNVDDRVLLLKGILISRADEEGRYLAIFEESGEDRHNPVLQVRLRNEVVIEGKKKDFLMDSAVAREVEREMAELGQQMQVDRIYVFTIDEKEARMDNILEWCAEGIPSYIDDLKGIRISEYPWWMNRLRKNQWIQVEEVSRMPRSAFREQEILAAQGIRAVLVAPIFLHNQLAGFVGVDHNKAARIWHEQELKALQLFREEMEEILLASLGTGS